MTDPNADPQQHMLAPAADPWADQTEADPWLPPDPVGPTAPLGPGGSQFSPGQASIPSTQPYSGTSTGYSAGYPSVPQPPSGRGSRAVAVVLAVLAVVLIGAGILVVPRLLSAAKPTPTTNPSSPAASGTGSPGTATTADIFAGTPAAAFGQGADGIVLPTNPSPVSGFTTDQINADLTQVKKGLVAGRLDARMLNQHDGTALTDLLAPDARGSITGDFTNKQEFPFATELGAGTILTHDTIRVSGTFTLTGQVRNSINELDVVTNFVWVYPVASGRTGAGANLIVVHDKVTWTFALDQQVQASSRGMFLSEAHGYANNIDCEKLKLGQVGIGPNVQTTIPATDPNSAYNMAADFDTVRIAC